jgi:hypothetical protein
VRICTVEGCGARHRARGLCARHYSREYPPGTRWGPLRSDNLKACTMGEGWQASLVSLVRRMRKDAA